MKLLMRRAATGILSIFATGALAITALSAVDLRQAHLAIAGWPAASKLAAAAMLDKYGPPDSAMETDLTWHHRGEWERIAVYRDEIPTRRAGIIEHVVRYEVPVGSWRDLFMLQLGVSYEPIGQTLSAASDSEQTNILALNVADDVIEGRMEVWQARQFYVKTLDLANSGKSSPYTRSLRFKPAKPKHASQPGQLWPMT